MTPFTILLWIVPLFLLWKLKKVVSRRNWIKSFPSKVLYWFFAPIAVMLVAPLFNAFIIFLAPELIFQDYYIKGYWKDGVLYQHTIYEAFGGSLIVAYMLNLGTWIILYLAQFFMMPTYNPKEDELEKK